MSRLERIPSSKDHINQIIIYDKPNKPQVPEEIRKQSRHVNLGQGDIVLTRQESSTDLSKTVRNLKRERDDENVEQEELNIKTEYLINMSQDYERSSPQLFHTTGDPPEDPTGITEDLFEELPDPPSPDPPAPAIPSDPPSTPSDPPSTFKRPRGRPKKSESKVNESTKPKSTEVSESTKPKCTVLNFIMKHRIHPEVSLISDAFDDASKSNEDEGQVSRPARLRRRPARFSYAEPESEEHYRIDTDVLLSRNNKNSSVSITPIYKCKQSSEQSEEQGNEVSTSKTNEKSPKKPAKKLTAKKDLQKKPDKLKKNIKEECNEEEEVEEQDEQLMDTSHEDNMSDSDDSRREWEPEELVELKQQHLMKLTKTMYKCKFCTLEFQSYYAVRKHRILEHDDMGRVGKNVGKYSLVEEETDETSKEDSDGESRDEWMPEDYAEYKVNHSLNKKKKNGSRYNCKICLLHFNTYYQLSKHKLEHQKQENPYECKYCPEKFNDIDNFVAHTRVHQGKVPYPCQKCTKAFENKEDLIKHRMQVHVLKKAPELPKRYRCDVCSKEFAKLGDIERHTRVHTGEKPAECNICHKRFQQHHNLTKHLLIHLHVKPFLCEICNKKFGRIDVLNRHLLTHSIEKPFKCELCDKGFIRQHQLTNHNGKAHPELFEVEDENAMMMEDMTDGEMT